jgi:uncharacterized membrane protein
MNVKDVIKYLRRMLFSITFMLLVALGMATGNPWLQYGSIFIIIIGQIVYQIFKSIRSAPTLNANMIEANKAKKGKLLYTATKNDVLKIKSESGGTGSMGMSSKTLFLMFIPLIIFFTTSYALGIVAPTLPRWQSYLTGVLFSLPASTIITVKAGITPSEGPIASPNTYYVSEKGIIFEHYGNSFILSYPIKKLNVNKEKNFIEVEGQSVKSVIIPNRLKLFNKDINVLQRILVRFTDRQPP